ncbi:MAG: CopG family ribbon-helix-helix protein [Thermoplasmatota archaeon]
MSVVSVSLPDPLVRQVDRLIDEGGYSGRTDVIRAAIRSFLAQQETAGAADGRDTRTGTITLVYEEGSRRILELRHTYARLIRSALHSHSGGNCVEVFIVEGNGKALRSLVDELRAARETLLVHLAFTDTRGVQARS